MIFQNKKEFLHEIQIINKFKVLGIDFGLERSGLSIYHSEINIVMPLSTIYKIVDNLNNLIILLNKNHIHGIVIGYPITLDAKETMLTEEIKRFALKLLSKINIAIIFSDERFTTSLTNTLLKQVSLKRKERNKIDDIISASIILENFFY